MKKNIVLLCLIFFTSMIKAQIDSTLANQLQNVLDNRVANGGDNGVSAHLIMPNGQVWNGTAGVGKENLPITETTLFHGASTTKFNIAILMLLLAEENLVDLDESWTNYVSLNANFDSTITIRHLLNHTSGIKDYLETANSGNEVTANFDYFFTPQHILENVVNDAPNFPVGTNFQYSNSNYALAALIIETVTGNPVHIELRNRIWTPLGMTHTYFGGHETYTEPTAGVWWNFGSGLTNYNDVPTTSMLSYGYGAGNIVSCPTDLAILLNSVLNEQFLNPLSLTEMLTFIPDSYNSWTAGYGLGIHHLSGETEDMVIGHDGYYTNLTDMFYSMNYGFTLVTMTNTQTEWFAIYREMYEILKTYFINTDLPEITTNFNLIIYPNPTKNQLTIRSSKNIDAIEVRNIFGQLCFQIQPYDKKASLTIDDDGLYFIVVKSAQQTVTKKLVVRN